MFRRAVFWPSLIVMAIVAWTAAYDPQTAALWVIGITMVSLTLLVPAVGTVSIIRERERNTLDLLRTSALRIHGVFWAKFLVGPCGAIGLLAACAIVLAVLLVSGAQQSYRSPGHGWIWVEVVLVGPLMLWFVSAVAAFWAWTARRMVSAFVGVYATLAAFYIGLPVLFGLARSAHVAVAANPFATVLACELGGMRSDSVAALVLHVVGYAFAAGLATAAAQSRARSAWRGRPQF